MSDMTLTLPAPALRELAGDLSGSIVVPGDENWDDARQAWNLAVDQQPAAVAFPETAADVAAIVRVAADLGLRVAAQTTGHNAAPLANTSLDDTILLRTSAMRGVTIDAENRRARVESGAVWAEVRSRK